MRVIRCEQCGTPLPWTAQYCAKCGRPVYSHAKPAHENNAAPVSGKYVGRPRPGALKTSTFYKMEQGDPDETQRLGRSQSQARTDKAGALSFPLSPSPVAAIDESSGARDLGEDWSEDAETQEMLRRGTWQKIVTRVTPAVTAFSGTVPSAIPATPVTPVTPWTPDSPSARTAFVPGAPPPYYKNRLLRSRRSPLMPHLAGWVAVAVILALLLGGGFGVFVSLGHNQHGGPTPGPLSLQATPSSIAFGGIVTLRGSHFTPNGRVGLTRDTSIPLIDTNGSSNTKANANGSFSDTISIDGTWTAGAHSISAEDAHLHKTASISIQVTGKSLSSLPAHLELSPTSVDLGSGDQATNSVQLITLSNAGGGTISWQSTVTQPWLMLTPQSGTLAAGQPMQVTLACDRSNLRVGSYSASVIFTSNVGSFTLPIKMRVTQLQAGHEPVMQVTPAVLSFTSVDGSASPPPQVVTISNPGALSLQWNVASQTSDGSNWLSASPSSGTVTKGNGQSVTVSVNSSLLLPGVYYGTVIFSSPGSQTVDNSPQTIYVSVTIQPQCAVQVSPGSLAFAGVYLQPAPTAKSISVGVNQSCSARLNWSASVATTSGGNWLTITPSRGTTPSTPSVGINPTGLKPGNYSGTLIFSSAQGTQTLPVTLVMGQPTTPIMAAAPALLNANGVVGQTQPLVQSITVSNTGGGTLSWSAVAATSVGGAWMTVTPPSGVLTSHQTTTITVTVTVLKTLVPGTYTGTVTISGKDTLGHAAAGSPQTLPVAFIVQAPCSLSTPVPALVFQGVIGQPAPASQPITIDAAGACANALSWSATVATVPAGGTWLTATPATGTVSVAVPSLTSAGIVTTGLLAGTYSGSITITAIDSVTHLPVGTPQVVTVTLTVQPTCTLQAPSVAAETFTSEAGLNPAAQTFTIGVIGACTGSVTITPTATMTNGVGWLAVTPTSAIVAPNGTATFHVAVTSATLVAGSYGGTISLAALNSSGIAITGSPQSVGVTFSVLAPPALSTAPTSLTFTITPGVSTQIITITNTGGEPLNWSAALPSSAPGYVTITPPASGSLAAGASASITISVDATALPAGTTASTSVTIIATDPLTTGGVSGSPSVVAISITITAPPAMQLSTTALAFTTTVGANPPALTLTVTNTGGGTLNWTAGAPVYTPPTSPLWLTVSPSSGSNAAGGTSTPSFNVNVTGLTTGSYTATVDFTAPGGISQTVTVTLTIS
jgi:Viral BACON domain